MVKLEVQKIKFSKVTFYAFQIKKPVGSYACSDSLGHMTNKLKKKKFVSKYSRQLCSRAICTRHAQTFMFDIAIYRQARVQKTVNVILHNLVIFSSQQLNLCEGAQRGYKLLSVQFIKWSFCIYFVAR